MPTTSPIFSGTLNVSVAATAFKLVPASADWVSVVLDVTTISGDGATAAFRLQWSLDGATWAEAGDTFDPITAPGTVIKRFPTKAPYWRAVCNLTGTNPSFTGSANCYS
jgi:hypothetical protein